MKKVVFSLLFLNTLLFSTTIKEIIDSSLTKNYDLKSLEFSIELASNQILQVKKWQNPTIGFEFNNLVIGRNRQNILKEYGVEISQTIPIGSSLSIQKSISQKDRALQELLFEDKKLEMESKIYQYSYTILVLENRRKLLKNYKNNLQRVKEQYLKLYIDDKANLNEILNTQIKDYDLQLQEKELENQIANLYLFLEQITYLNIEKIEDNLELTSINIDNIEESIEKHPRIESLEIESKKQRDFAKLEDAKKFSELTLSLEYLQNDEQEWANVMVTLPLPIYNRENINKLKAKINTKDIKTKKDKEIYNLKLQNRVIMNNINLAKESFELINSEIIPRKIKLHKVLEEFVGFSKISLTENLNNLNELIIYEIKANEELAKYYENYSELIYYSNRGIK